MLIRGAGGGGGALILGGGAELVRGGGAELARPSPRDISGPRPIPGCIMERGGVIDGCAGIRCVTTPLLCTCCETLSIFDSPRGTPNPAELFRIMILLPDWFANDVTGPRFTAKIVPLTGVVAGGWGRLKPPGVFRSMGCE